MQNRSGGSKRRGLSPLEGDENSDTEIATTSAHRMHPKVRKFSTERDLFAEVDGPQFESKLPTYSIVQMTVDFTS